MSTKLILLEAAMIAAWGVSLAGIWLLPVAAVIVAAQAAGTATVATVVTVAGEGEKSSLYRTLAAAVNALRSRG
jgi:hypothetical protein